LSLDWLYIAISWILLRWHDLWEAVGVPTERVLGTTWTWILSIVFLVVTLRVLLFPIFVKQIKSQRAMQALQPKVKELQEKHKGDRETLQKEMMELYKREKANPLMGCLPILLQGPVFLALYHVLKRLSPTNPHPGLYGWRPTDFYEAARATLFTAPVSSRFGSTAAELHQLGVTQPGMVKVIAGVIVLIMIATTYLSSRQMILKTGWAEDPQQKMVQRLMLYGIPLMLLISGSVLPIGVMIYWVTNNLFSLAQQQWVLRKYPPPPMAKKAGAGAAATPARSSGASNGKAAKPAGQQTRPSGIFSRGRAADDADAAKPVIDGRALAPKPGAKPANPRASRPNQTGPKKGARPAKPKG
jgi:YidC/Oxa1 family membrane protein insertase